jgi:release factor glutamine methyltransferase
MLTVLEIIKRTTEFLAGRGVAPPRLNAELLIGHALGRKRMQLYLEFERPLTEAELGQIRPLVRRRGQHEPLQYVLGETEFCGLRLKVDRRVLIPRPETELLVELVLAWCAANPPGRRIMDLGTGSGAIALALGQAMPEAGVVAIERSREALAVAGENAAAAGLGERISLVLSDWYATVPVESFDVIVANPPYLSAEETAATPLEVHGFEPVAALTAPADGFADLEAIIAGAPRYLRQGGLLAIETGIAQHARLRAAIRAAGFSHAESKRDLTGRDRFILAGL